MNPPERKAIPKRITVSGKDEQTPPGYLAIILHYDTKGFTRLAFVLERTPKQTLDSIVTAFKQLYLA